MPYTNRNDRVKFKELIVATVNDIMGGSESDYIKGEYFCYWVHRVLRKYVRDPQADSSSFNSTTFNADKLRKLSASADKVASLIDPAIQKAGDLNYPISAVYLGITGEADGVDEARYGFRAFLKGGLEKILNTLFNTSTGSQADVTMAFRRNLIARGVLSDVIDEFYWISTREYEDRKMMDNGAIWVDGELVLPD